MGWTFQSSCLPSTCCVPRAIQYNTSSTTAVEDFFSFCFFGGGGGRRWMFPVLQACDDLQSRSAYNIIYAFVSTRTSCLLIQPINDSIESRRRSHKASSTSHGLQLNDMNTQPCFQISTSHGAISQYYGCGQISTLLRAMASSS